MEVWVGLQTGKGVVVLGGGAGEFEWIPIPSEPLERDQSLGALSEFDTKAALVGYHNGSEFPVRLRRRTFAWGNAPYIIYLYSLENTSVRTEFKGVSLGVEADFDLPGGSVKKYAEDDIAILDADRNIAWMTNEAEGVAAGVRLLGKQPSHLMAWDINDDPATDEEQYQRLTASNESFESTADDWRILVSSDPVNLAPGDVAYFAFAMIAAENGEELLDMSEAVENVWEHVISGRIGASSGEKGAFHVAPMAEVPSEFVAPFNYPNPFNSATTIRFGLPEASEVELRVFNVQGQEIAELMKGNMTEGFHTLVWQADHLPSGVYFLRMITPRNVSVRKVLLFR